MRVLTLLTLITLSLAVPLPAARNIPDFLRQPGSLCIDSNCVATSTSSSVTTITSIAINGMKRPDPCEKVPNKCSWYVQQQGHYNSKPTDPSGTVPLATDLKAIVAIASNGNDGEVPVVVQSAAAVAFPTPTFDIRAEQADLPCVDESRVHNHRCNRKPGRIVDAKGPDYIVNPNRNIPNNFGSQSISKIKARQHDGNTGCASNLNHDQSRYKQLEDALFLELSREKNLKERFSNMFHTIAAALNEIDHDLYLNKYNQVKGIVEQGLSDIKTNIAAVTRRLNEEIQKHNAGLIPRQSKYSGNIEHVWKQDLAIAEATQAKNPKAADLDPEDVRNRYSESMNTIKSHLKELSHDMNYFDAYLNNQNSVGRDLEQIEKLVDVIYRVETEIAKEAGLTTSTLDPGHQPDKSEHFQCSGHLCREEDSAKNVAKANETPEPSEVRIVKRQDLIHDWIKQCFERPDNYSCINMCDYPGFREVSTICQVRDDADN